MQRMVGFRFPDGWIQGAQRLGGPADLAGVPVAILALRNACAAAPRTLCNGFFFVCLLGLCSSAVRSFLFKRLRCDLGQAAPMIFSADIRGTQNGTFVGHNGVHSP